MKRSTGTLLIVLAVCTGSQTAQAAIVFTTQTAFQTAVGAGLVTEDFEGVPITSGEFGAFSNGAAFQGFTLTSLTHGSDVNLQDLGNNPTGLFGTFLAQEQGSGNIWVRPGGQGLPGDPQDNDDFRFDLTTPALAFGLPIIDNRIDEAGEPESVDFLGAGNILIMSVPLPGNSSGSGSSGFVGLLLEPGDPLITRVEVYEGVFRDDDIVIDDIMLKAVPLPAASWLLVSAIGILISRIRI